MDKNGAVPKINIGWVESNYFFIIFYNFFIAYSTMHGKNKLFNSLEKVTSSNIFMSYSVGKTIKTDFFSAKDPRIKVL